MEEHPVERFPVAGKWYRRWGILFIFLLAAWVGLGSVTVAQFVLAVALGAQGSVAVLAEVYAVVRGRGEYIELLENGVLITFGLPLWSRRIKYEVIRSVDLGNRWTDRVARSVLGIVGRANPPRVELRFRRRVWLWWFWPLEGLAFRPLNPEGVVGALSARLRTA